MEGKMRETGELVELAARVWGKRWHYLALALLIYGVSTVALWRLDLLPERAPLELTVASTTPDIILTSERPEPPLSIAAEKIGLSATIENPETTDIAALDKLLLKGAVRYPTSARLGEQGNVVLFGHSSYLPIVGNQAYKTFNDIQKLAEGDLIEVAGEGVVYVYRVENVSKENAEENTPIPLTMAGKKLTLVTCNSFGKKSDRFIVVAKFVESHPAPLPS